MVKPIEWKDNKIRILDQRELPHHEVYLTIHNPLQLVGAINSLAIRGAPLLGLAGAWGVYLGVHKVSDDDREAFFKELFSTRELLLATRPTAVNLSTYIDRILAITVSKSKMSVEELKDAILEEIRKIEKEEKNICRAIGEVGAKLIEPGAKVLTHCNTGLLATGGIGTALATLYVAKEKGIEFTVVADETRPLLQGSRLTAWELKSQDIIPTVITDSTAGWAMKSGLVDIVIVGADRIAANGDVANKIGTYTLAILAKAHKIPFYVAAPTSTFDLNISSGDEIPIEQRNPDEVRKFMGRLITPQNVLAWAPAFDITPAKYITGIITEKGLIRKPTDEKIKKKVL